MTTEELTTLTTALNTLRDTRQEAIHTAYRESLDTADRNGTRPTPPDPDGHPHSRSMTGSWPPSCTFAWAYPTTLSRNCSPQAAPPEFPPVWWSLSNMID
ncbi:hypothetical protein [Actinoplanes sp. NBRC 103695]|uniref:hypothetical protein n=1 Tax=Actinoplanes sp. NBRC 103695 TaxID=3032202 RepID=UPI0024A08BFC|nr:hypothetical protein [Actinoplanes sp. NBRC 103695]GLZ02512.1 hypothetical protein Acsp02_97630 [Actinoplanes sp. NBRC 103695]